MCVAILWTVFGPLVKAFSVGLRTHGLSSCLCVSACASSLLRGERISNFGAYERALSRALISERSINYSKLSN